MGRQGILVVMLALGLAMTGLLPTSSADQSTFQFTSEPPTMITVGQTLNYEARTTVRPDSVVMVEHPEGMTSSGVVIKWTPALEQVGTHHVLLWANDTKGHVATQEFMLEVVCGTNGSIDMVLLEPTAQRKVRDPGALKIKGLVGPHPEELEVIVRFSEQGRWSSDWEPVEVNVTGHWTTSPPSDLGPGKYEYTVKAVASDAREGYVSGTFEVVEPPSARVTTVVVATTPIFLIITMLIGLAMTDIGKTKLVALFLLPLYSKLKKDSLLDQFTRGEIHHYIKVNPGDTYTDIKKGLGLNNGTLTHHIQILQHNGLVHSKRNGMFRHYYQIEVPLPKVIFRLNKAQKDIIEMVRLNPGISQSKLSEGIGITVSTVNYHLQHLSDADLVKIKKAGTKTKCYIEGKKK